jgi:hypothetical protein
LDKEIFEKQFKSKKIRKSANGDWPNSKIFITTVARYSIPELAPLPKI